MIKNINSDHNRYILGKLKQLDKGIRYLLTYTLLEYFPSKEKL